MLWYSAFLFKQIFISYRNYFRHPLLAPVSYFLRPFSSIRSSTCSLRRQYFFLYISVSFSTYILLRILIISYCNFGLIYFGFIAFIYDPILCTQYWTKLFYTDFSWSQLFFYIFFSFNVLEDDKFQIFEVRTSSDFNF